MPLKDERCGCFAEVACHKDRTASNGQVTVRLVKSYGDFPILAVPQRRLLTSGGNQRPVPPQEVRVLRRGQFVPSQARPFEGVE